MQLRKATFEDVLALDMREHDKQHMVDFFGEIPWEAIVASNPVAVEHGGKVLALFGCGASPSFPSIGCPWLLLGKNTGRVMTARMSRIIVDQWLEDFEMLFNYVHPDNETSQRWLTWLGFFPGPVEHVGVFGKPFIPFYKTRNV